jgi:hypothetical protein
MDEVLGVNEDPTKPSEEATEIAPVPDEAQ